jgi:hypothetical protein
MRRGGTDASAIESACLPSVTSKRFETCARRFILEIRRNDRLAIDRTAPNCDSCPVDETRDVPFQRLPVEQTLYIYIKKDKCLLVYIDHRLDFALLFHVSMESMNLQQKIEPCFFENII